MKNVFAIEHTKNAEAFHEYDGACFIYDQINDELQAEQDKVLENTQKSMKHLGISLIRIVPKYLLLSIGLIFIAKLVSTMFDAGITLSESLRENFWLYVISVTCLAASGILFIVDKISAKKYENSAEFKDYLEHAEQIAQVSMRALGIPEDSDSAEILSFVYKIKKDKTVSANSYDFMPLDMFIFTDEERLYLSDSCTLFAFKKSNILRIEKVDKKATMALWLKDEELRSAEYKPYKMSETNDGNITIKNYYSLQLTADSDEGVFEILLPPYEIDRVAAMLGMTVTDRPY